MADFAKASHIGRDSRSSQLLPCPSCFRRLRHPTWAGACLGGPFPPAKLARREGSGGVVQSRDDRDSAIIGGMDVYILRHAIAETAEGTMLDSERALTEEGRVALRARSRAKP